MTKSTSDRNGGTFLSPYEEERLHHLHTHTHNIVRRAFLSPAFVLYSRYAGERAGLHNAQYTISVILFLLSV